MVQTQLSMRERMRLDALFVRVRRGDHYEVLGVKPDATNDEVARAHAELAGFLGEVLRPNRDLGEHRVRAEAVLRAVENAWRIVGNRRERLRYDAQQHALPGSGPLSAAIAPSEAPATPAAQRGTARRPRAEAVLPAHLLAALEATLGVILRRNLDLQAFAGGTLDLRDPTAALRAAELAEREERWFDAAVWWHLAALAAPTDPQPFLRAASAMRRGGVPSSFERYQQAVNRAAVFSDPAQGRDDGGASGR
ncbi:MAG: hypothetical protein U0325_08045 [Polyangiales bacterium]